jgi:hypothetical protein
MFMVLGLAARMIRYLLRFPLWEDECFLAVNFMDRGFWELTQPLAYHQAAPLLFLWSELASVKLCGFNELSLRLIPFLASIGSLFLFRHVAGRLLQGTALVLAVAIFAVSYPMIRYAAEAKPYGLDLFISLTILALTIEWCRRPGQSRWLWMLAAFVPLAVGLSYPAVFVGGGMSLVLAAMLWTQGGARGWLAWVAYNAALVGSFAAVFLLAARHQSGAELDFMQQYWRDSFPPFDSVVNFLVWFAKTHTSGLVAYPVGGERGASALTAILCAAGIAYLVRSRRWTLVAWCIAPLALNFVAAALHRYPYGGHMKFSQFVAPIVCLLAGLGATRMLTWNLGQFASSQRRLIIFAGLLAAIGLGSIARDFATPYKSTTDLRERDFARAFWSGMSMVGEVACVKTDLGEEFSPSAYRELCWTAAYLCNQRIYSPQHARGERPNFDKVSAAWPLRCVQYESGIEPDDPTRREHWLQSMQARYDLVGTEIVPIPCYGQNGRGTLSLDKVEIFRFVPKGSLATPTTNVRR